MFNSQNPVLVFCYLLEERELKQFYEVVSLNGGKEGRTLRPHVRIPSFAHMCGSPRLLDR